MSIFIDSPGFVKISLIAWQVPSFSRRGPQIGRIFLDNQMNIFLQDKWGGGLCWQEVRTPSPGWPLNALGEEQQVPAQERSQGASWWGHFPGGFGGVLMPDPL